MNLSSPVHGNFASRIGSGGSKVVLIQRDFVTLHEDGPIVVGRMGGCDWNVGGVIVQRAFPSQYVTACV